MPSTKLQPEKSCVFFRVYCAVFRVWEGCRASEAGLSVRHYLITGIDKSKETAGDAFFTRLSFHGRVQSPEVQQLYFSNSMYTSNIQRAAQNLFVGLSVSGWLKAPDLMRAQRALGVKELKAPHMPSSRKCLEKVLEIKERYLSCVGRGIPYKCSFWPKRKSFITTMFKEL